MEQDEYEPDLKCVKCGHNKKDLRRAAILSHPANPPAALDCAHEVPEVKLEERLEATANGHPAGETFFRASLLGSYGVVNDGPTENEALRGLERLWNQDAWEVCRLKKAAFKAGLRTVKSQATQRRQEYVEKRKRSRPCGQCSGRMNLQLRGNQESWTCPRCHDESGSMRRCVTCEQPMGPEGCTGCNMPPERPAYDALVELVCRAIRREREPTRPVWADQKAKDLGFKPEAIAAAKEALG